MRQRNCRMQRWLPYLIILAVFLIATGAVVELYRDQNQPPAPTGKLAFGKAVSTVGVAIFFIGKRSARG